MTRYGLQSEVQNQAGIHRSLGAELHGTYTLPGFFSIFDLDSKKYIFYSIMLSLPLAPPLPLSSPPQLLLHSFSFCLILHQKLPAF